MTTGEYIVHIKQQNDALQRTLDLLHTKMVELELHVSDTMYSVKRLERLVEEKK